jgi:hypothetical protein
MLGEKAYGLVTGLDGLHHVPHSGVLPDEVGLAELSGLVVGLTFCSFNDVSEVFVLQGIFTLVAVHIFFFLLVIVLIRAVLVDLWGSRDWISVHVVVKLVLHFLLNSRLAACSLYGSKLCRVNDAGGCLASNLV